MVVFWAHRSAAGWIRDGGEEGADGVVVLISSVCFGELGRTFRDVGLALLARLLLCCLILENADRFESSCLRCGVSDAGKWTDPSVTCSRAFFEWDFFGTRKEYSLSAKIAFLFSSVEFVGIGSQAGKPNVWIFLSLWNFSEERVL